MDAKTKKMISLKIISILAAIMTAIMSGQHLYTDHKDAHSHVNQYEEIAEDVIEDVLQEELGISPSVDLNPDRDIKVIK